MSGDLGCKLDNWWGFFFFFFWPVITNFLHRSWGEILLSMVSMPLGRDSHEYNPSLKIIKK